MAELEAGLEGGPAVGGRRRDAHRLEAALQGIAGFEPEDAFAYTADFANIEDWDPGVAASAQIGDDPIGIGTAFDVLVAYGSRRIPMVYTIAEYDPPRRVVLIGEGSTLTAVDTIEFGEGGHDHDDQRQPWSVSPRRLCVVGFLWSFDQCQGGQHQYRRDSRPYCRLGKSYIGGIHNHEQTG